MGSRISISGTLASQATQASWAGRNNVVHLVVAVPTGLPIVLDWPFGDGATAGHCASSAASALRKGTPVTVTGQALTLTRHRGEPALRLTGAVHVDRPLQPSFTEAAEATLQAT